LAEWKKIFKGSGKDPLPSSRFDVIKKRRYSYNDNGENTALSPFSIRLRERERVGKKFFPFRGKSWIGQYRRCVPKIGGKEKRQ
jgi:hypothetical protein